MAELDNEASVGAMSEQDIGAIARLGVTPAFILLLVEIDGKKLPSRWLIVTFVAMLALYILGSEKLGWVSPPYVRISFKIV